MCMQDKPLFGLTCTKVSDSRCYLVQAQHHIITDGWCTALCMEDLTRYLQEEMTGQFTEERPSAGGRYEAAVREILRKNMKAGLNYWRELLSGYETRAEVPSYGTVPENERSEEDLLTVVLDAEKTRQLEQLCGQEGATLSNAVELAWGPRVFANKPGLLNNKCALLDNNLPLLRRVGICSKTWWNQEKVVPSHSQ